MVPMDSRWIRRLRRVEMPKYKGKEYAYTEKGMKDWKKAKQADRKKRKASQK